MVFESFVLLHSAKITLLKSAKSQYNLVKKDGKVQLFLQMFAAQLN